MALIFTESFDGVAVPAHLSGKWGIGAGTSFVVGRNSNGMQVDGSVAGSESFIDLLAADQHQIIIIGFAIKPTAFTATVPLISFYSAGRGTPHCIVYTNGAAGSLGAHNPAGGLVGVWSNALTANVWQYVELKIVVGDSGVGSMELKVNQIGFGVISGDFRAGTPTTVSAIGVWKAVNGLQIFDDLTVCNAVGTKNNTFIGDCKIECIRPNGNGNTSQLLGSDSNSIDNYLLVDEVAVDDADFVGSATNEQQDTYACSDLVSTVGRIAGVQTMVRALKMDAAAKSIAILSRLGINETAGADNPLTTSYAPYRRLMETNPAAADWTIANVNAAEFGVRVRP